VRINQQHNKRTPPPDEPHPPRKDMKPGAIESQNSPHEIWVGGPGRVSD
jgi:hypothetical protein